MQWRKIFKRNKPKIHYDEKPEKELNDSKHCLNCGSGQWYEGPHGALAINIKCAGCGLWFNATPFGLDFIGIKDNELPAFQGKMPKEIRWYCPTCETFELGNVDYGKYPHCPKCENPLKVCWTYKNFPAKFCEICDSRFKCFTERGNF